jgi:hypothetical protein
MADRLCSLDAHLPALAAEHKDQYDTVIKQSIWEQSYCSNDLMLHHQPELSGAI